MVAKPEITLDQLHELAAGLPDLAFSPSRDSLPALGELTTSYLDYYGIDFRDDYFYRLGRLIHAPYTLACHYWLPLEHGEPRVPEKGVVMVIHGYFDHVGLYGHLIRYLLGCGYGVMAFDLPGHGLSSGERASIESFDHYVEVFQALLALVKSQFNCPVSAVGQSTGGAILLKHLAETCEETGSAHPALDRVTLLAPLVEPAFWWFNKLVYALSRHRIKGIPRKFRDNSADSAFCRFLREDPLQPDFLPIDWLGAMKGWVEECRDMPPCPCPVTILQGKRDTTLSWRSNIKLLQKKFPNADIHLLDGVQHHMVNESPELREKILGLTGF